MTYKLIAFDLDGTLLDDDKNISGENLSALKEAAEKGAFIVPATGRVFPALPEKLKKLSFIRYYILSNGACVYDRIKDEVIYRGEIPTELAIRCIKYMDALPVIYDCYKDDRGYMTESMYNSADEYLSDQPHILQLVKDIRIPVPDLAEYLREAGGGLQKLQMFFRPQHMDLREKEFENLERAFPELKASSSLKNNVEINSINAGKGTALTHLAGILGIEKQETMAFGDGTNDTEMLLAAGCGVAMENAVESVKRAADMITLNNNASGVAYAVRKLMNTENI